MTYGGNLVTVWMLVVRMVETVKSSVAVGFAVVIPP